MRKLIAMALLGASAAFMSATVPAQAMTAGVAGVTKSAVPADSNVTEVGRRHRHWRHRHYRHRHWGHRHHRHRHWRHRHYYGYYGNPYFYPRYRRRPGFGLYFGF